MAGFLAPGILGEWTEIRTASGDTMGEWTQCARVEAGATSGRRRFSVGQPITDEVTCDAETAGAAETF